MIYIIILKYIYTNNNSNNNKKKKKKKIQFLISLYQLNYNGTITNFKKISKILNDKNLLKFFKLLKKIFLLKIN